MKISIFTTIGNELSDGYDRGDCIDEALESYHSLADEVVVVDGSKCETLWEWDWSWERLPKQMNYGLEKCTGDWVIRCDIDYVFHEDNIKEIRERLERLKLYPVATFQKYSIVLHNAYYQKGGVPIAINKGNFPNYMFGQATNAKTDLCYPILRSGENDKGIPEGTYDPDRFGKVGLPFWNYDYSFKTEQQTREEFWRFAQAYYRYFKEWKFGKNEDESFSIFLDMMRGRYSRCVYFPKLEDHPKVMQKRISKLSPREFAHSGWGLL